FCPPRTYSLIGPARPGGRVRQVISAQNIDIRIGARQLLTGANFRINAGDRIGLVGRNGAGKTTLTRLLAGQGQPTAGTITSRGSVGYLPQDPRTGDLEQLARDRVLSARNLHDVVRRIRTAEAEMRSPGEQLPERAMARYRRLDAECTAQRGWAAAGEAARITASLALRRQLLGQPLTAAAGGQPVLVELARIVLSD